MELTKKQKEGLDIAIDRYNNNEKYTVISGYAGTGKSTLVKFIISSLYGIDKDEDVVFTSFTGKATQVLARKGNKNTMTLHKLLFVSVPKIDGGFIRKPVEEIPYKIVVVDEISMVPSSLLTQLSKYDVHIICLGDPFQLPPIDKNDDNHLLDSPHVFLDEVMRQAADSEIIQLTMKIRNGETITNFKGKDVQILNKDDLSTGMLLWADQILVATNATRTSINQKVRELLGRGDAPENGDKVICCRNYWEILNKNCSPLVNGGIGYLNNTYSSFVTLPGFLTSTGSSQNLEMICGSIMDEDGYEYENLNMDKQMIITGNKSIDFRTEYKAQRSKYKNIIPLEFLYGYAITCHRAQGSEWDNVLVIEESFPFNKTEHARWLYTALTRSAKKVVWIRPN